MSDEKIDLVANVFILIIALAFLIFSRAVTNLRSRTDWNDGICSKCEIRYELRAASYGLKYYVCPNCGKEVKRY